jgi:lipopolysaccharide transport system permease protein
MPLGNTAGAAAPVLRIEPARSWVPLHIQELFAYRELLYFFVWRDIKVRYKQTLLGGLWAIIQPLLTMVVFSVFFGRLAKVQSDGLPYPMFSYVALVPWVFFATGVLHSASSLIYSNDLISKVYFPRLLVPLSAVLANFLDFALASTVLAGLAAYYQVEVTARLLWLPALVLLLLSSSVAFGLWFAALNVRYRDVRHIVPFIIQLALFASPVAYSSSVLDSSWRLLYALNPMVGVIEGFRWALLGAGAVPYASLATSALVAAVVLVSGAYYFRRVEQIFADVL